MNNIKESLIGQARNKNICIPGLKRLCSEDVEKLVDYYLEIPDWCMERDFPDMETLTEHFSRCEDRGIYVNRHFEGELLNDLQTYIFHNCTGTIKTALNVEKKIAPMFYFANGCKMQVIGTGDAEPRRQTFIPLYVFGRNRIEAKDNNYVLFRKYKNALI